MTIDDIMLIGLDLSTNSTGICIRIGDIHHLIQCVPATCTKHPSILQVPYDKQYEKHVHEDINKCYAADRQSNLIVNIVRSYQKLYNVNDSATLIGIEGTSFGSRGKASRIVDLTIVNALVKANIARTFIKQNIKIFAPKSVKKTFCKNGNADKLYMIEYYRKYTKNYLHQINKPFDGWDAKIDDVVDAYAITESLMLHVPKLIATLNKTK